MHSYLKSPDFRLWRPGGEGGREVCHEALVQGEGGGSHRQEEGAAGKEGSLLIFVVFHSHDESQIGKGRQIEGDAEEEVGHLQYGVFTYNFSVSLLSCSPLTKHNALCMA